MKISCSRACRVAVLHKGSVFSVGLSQEHPCPSLGHSLDEITRGSSVALGTESSGSEDCPAGLLGVLHPTQLSKVYPPCPQHGSIPPRDRCVTPSSPSHCTINAGATGGWGMEKRALSHLSSSSPHLSFILPFFTLGVNAWIQDTWIYIPTLIMEASGHGERGNFCH